MKRRAGGATFEVKMPDKEQEIGELLSQLVAIPSVNPEGKDLALRPPYGEGRVADFVERYFALHNLRIERQEVYPGRDNVVVHVPGVDRAAPPICLEAHMDTVDVEGMEDPFAPHVADGKLHGRGACDTKASLAAMMLAVKRLLRANASLPRGVVLVAAADEEYGQAGVRCLARSGLPLGAAIVGEPTGLRVIPAHKGQVYLRIATRGRAAHTSVPERGANAIYLMSDVIQVLRRRAAEEHPRRTHALCGPPVLTVSVITGGVSEHIVPDACCVAIDRRTVPGETAESAVEELRRWLTEELGAQAMAAISIHPPHHAAPPMETPLDHPLVTQLARAVEGVRGGATVTGVPYNTDAGVLRELGVPTVVFGAGDIAQAHTREEFVDLAEVAAEVEILERFLLAF
jgi:succinyl-diaminopimelate desuccinylase